MAVLFNYYFRRSFYLLLVHNRAKTPYINGGKQIKR